MVLSLINLCARSVVSDHGSSPCWLACVPRELYRALLEAAFVHCRPLAIGELVQRWPERCLRVGGRRKAGHTPPNRLCVQALLLAVVRGLGDKRCALQVLDLCGLQCEDGGLVDSMGGWSLTVALCSMVLQARVAARGQVKRVQERKPLQETEGQRARKENGVQKSIQDRGGQPPVERQAEVRGVRRIMEMTRDRVKESQEAEQQQEAEFVVQVQADLFINARSWERVHTALATKGPLQLHCQHLRVEELPAASIVALLSLLPPRSLQGLDIHYSSLGVSGLALLLPTLARFPYLSSLRLHYCNLDVRRDTPGQEKALRDMAAGLGALVKLRQISLTALRLSGHLRLLLSSLSQPLEVLELPYLSLIPADLSYLSCSIHATSLRRLDLSENRLEEATLPSLCRLLSQASGSLTHLSLCGCGLSDSLLGALFPPLRCCRTLYSLGLALNPLSRTGVLAVVRVAASISSLRLLLHPNALEEYKPGLPPLPSSAQLLDWPLEEELDWREAFQAELEMVLVESERSNLLLTSDLLNYNSLLEEEA
ncbi:leucine-rich repeat-containing protein 14 isoform X1 [Brienomyrus brachyistius]|uniref:leucine-rich repeat-containing protein 14 isoform X1 n=1 Tax=Brienomyrus brachyistius TaxID=42636 RepID=UPI0020B45D70|nr:leucine-rich repeat-containing protein 14 isoform X1 [Brienomyrus brachyistius]